MTIQIFSFQQIPNVSPTGRYTTLLPLIFVLCCSAVKEIIEDWKRHRADDQTNNKLVQVIRNGILVEIKWTEVSVFDPLPIPTTIYLYLFLNMAINDSMTYQALELGIEGETISNSPNFFLSIRDWIRPGPFWNRYGLREGPTYSGPSAS